MIRILLSMFALMVIAYGIREWRRSRLVGLSLVMVSVVGALFVWLPDVADRIAAAMGVTRGADLVLYCYSAISFLMILNLALKQRELHESITRLARASALGAPRLPEKSMDDDAGGPAIKPGS
jgi:small membrane protein